jgi:hypothetical protein
MELARLVDRIVDSNEYNQQFGDWGVPGSGGLRYCGPNNAGAAVPSQSRASAVPATSGAFGHGSQQRRRDQPQ